MQKGDVFTLLIDAFDLDGAGVGTINGKAIKVFGALPGEEVEVEMIGRKKGQRLGRLLSVIKTSPSRQAPPEDHYLSCSPWQALSYDQELFWKKKLALELFASAGLKFHNLEIVTDGITQGYRNKMEFSLAERDGKINAVFHERMTRRLMPAKECTLAMHTINKALDDALHFLNTHAFPPHAAKSIVLRANRKEDTLLGLFVKDEGVLIPQLETSLGSHIKGISVFYSPPESPASRPEKLLVSVGEEKIYETILGKAFPMTVLSYFQINPPVFEIALGRMREFVSEGDAVLDFFSGVGAIGLSLGDRVSALAAVELDDASFKLLDETVRMNGGEVEAVHTSDRKARDLIDARHVLIMDPPRAGVHPKVIGRILEVLPPKIIYLSCNLKTQAHDVGLLKTHYHIKHAELFNFFPRTPHIESLLVLERI